MPISRKKSCFQCRAAKARCSLASTCSRCSERGFQCSYGDTPSRQSTYSALSEAPGHLRRDPIVEQPVSVQIEEFIEAEIRNHTLPSHLQGSEATENALRIVDLANPDWNRVDVLSSDPSLGLLNSLASFNEIPEQSCETGSLGQSNWPTNYSRMSPVLRNNDNGEQTGASQDGIFSGVERGHLTSYAKSYHNILSLRKPTSIQSFLTTKVLWGRLGMYPKMMIQGQLPPFVYPPCVLNDRSPKSCVMNGTHQCLPESLTICASLMHMFYRRTPQSCSFVWGSIYAEQRRLKSEYHNYDGHTLLAALQSIAIYMVLQAQDLDSIQYNDVSLMISNFLNIVTQLHKSSNFNYLCNMYKSRTLTLREWVFNESMTRTICVFYVLDSLLEANVGDQDITDCLTFDQVPLPGPQLLWDYNSREAWVYRLERFLAKETSEKVLTIGDLRMFRRSSPDLNLGESVVGEMAKWCEEIDEFGSLLWMVVLLN